MKRLVVIKIIICGVLCIGLAMIYKHMPQFMRGVYDSIFQTVDFTVFIFVVGLFFLEIFFLKKFAGDKSKYYICLGVTFIVSSLMLFNGHSDLYEKLAPSNNTILLNQPLAETMRMRSAFALFYFEDKNLTVSKEQNEHKEMFPGIFQLAVSPPNIKVDDEIVISEEFKNKLLLQPYFFSDQWGQDCYFVIDEYWEKSTDIVTMRINDEYLFCSKEFLESAQNYGERNDDVIYKNEKVNAYSILCKLEQATPYRKIKQIVIMLLLLALGLIFTLPVWGNNYPILALFLGFPIAVAGICIYGIVLMLLKIPYNLFSIFLGCFLLGGILIYRNRNSYKVLNKQLVLNFTLIAIGVIVFLVYTEICYTLYDSLAKCVIAYRLAKFGTLRDILFHAAPYGMLEPMILSIGYMVHCDLLYAFYPLMAISGIGVMCAGIYYTNRKVNYDVSMLVLGCGIVLLLSNYDFLLSCFFIVANGSIAVYMLILVVSLVMKRRINIPCFEVIAVMAAIIIFTTRVEGTVYILFILIASLGLENEHLRLQRVNIIVVFAIIVWNVYQMMFVGGEADGSFFWTSDKGILLIDISLVALLVTLLINIQCKFMIYIRTKYFLVLMLATISIAVFAAVFMRRSMASLNFPIFLAHFSNSVEDYTNSAALWTFIFLLFPVILSMKKKESEYALTVILGYIILIFTIFLFRNSSGDGDLPLRFGISDSARRMIVQIMPTAVWLLAYCMEEKRVDDKLMRVIKEKSHCLERENV